MYPRISIIIITYNRVDIFKKSLQSAIISLGNKDSEIVVIDNSNKEIQKRNINLINKLKCDFNIEINYLAQNKNLGVAGGRNLGIKYSKNAKCLFIDDDAYIIQEPEVLDRVDFTVTAASGKFIIDGVDKPALNLDGARYYRFDLLSFYFLHKNLEHYCFFMC